MYGFMGAFQCGLRLGRFRVLILGQAQELMGFQTKRLKGFCGLILGFFSLPVGQSLVSFVSRGC